MNRFALRTTNDYDSMLRLGKEAGLEIEEVGPVLVAYGVFDGEKMIGCACLKEHEGAFLLECLAVRPDMRKAGLGTRLVRAVEEDARKCGAKRILALARSPEFFRRVGYRVAKPDEFDYPSTAGCRGCPQYMASCAPAVVVRDL